jgi:hypothetical protein
MLDIITVLEYFLTVRCLAYHCIGCEVNCNWFTESAYQFTFHIVTLCYDGCLERQFSRLINVAPSMNKLFNTDILIQELPKMGTL